MADTNIPGLLPNGEPDTKSMEWRNRLDRDKWFADLSEKEQRWVFISDQTTHARNADR
jgi:hypothetical protein